MKKKVLSIFILVCVLITSLALPMSAFGLTRNIELNVRTTNKLDGYGDMNRYAFTPEKSGTYTLLSYNVYASEAYLLVKEKDPETGKKYYNTLEYSNLSPDFKANGQSGILQFCLTYHLDAGTTYYYDVGWTQSYTYDREGVVDMTVLLRCDAYDENPIERIEITCPAVLNAYTGGDWEYDEEKVGFYYYDISRVVLNMKVTLYYADGSVSSAIGADEIDGYNILYLHSQKQNHWYPQSIPEYKANTLTVKVVDDLNVTCGTIDFDVPIVISALYGVKGIIVDYAGNPVENASIVDNGLTLTKTDSNGKFYCTLSPGAYNLQIISDNAISRDVSVIVAAVQDGNDFTAKPISLVTCDYVKDGIINAKDYSFMIKNLSADALDIQRTQFEKVINFSKENYEKITLVN